MARAGLKLKSGAVNSIQFFHTGGRVPTTSPLPPSICISRELEPYTDINPGTLIQEVYALILRSNKYYDLKYMYIYLGLALCHD